MSTSVDVDISSFLKEPSTTVGSTAKPLQTASGACTQYQPLAHDVRGSGWGVVARAGGRVLPMSPPVLYRRVAVHLAEPWLRGLTVCWSSGAPELVPIDFRWPGLFLIQV